MFLQDWVTSFWALGAWRNPGGYHGVGELK